MKKLIFGLTVFVTSVLGIICTNGIDELTRCIYITTDNLLLAMSSTGFYQFGFVITAAVGFVFALIGVFTREKSDK